MPPKRATTASTTRSKAAPTKTQTAPTKAPPAKKTATTKKAAAPPAASKKRKADEDNAPASKKLKDSNPSIAPTSTATKKRKAEDEPPATTTTTSKKAKSSKDVPAASKSGGIAKVTAAPAPKKPRVTKPKAVKAKKVINTAPTARLDVYIFGEGSSAELGLGAEKTAIDVKRPRLNPLLAADTVGVVQLAVGGMHCAALTHDNKILTWGGNDQGALGRDTTWDGGMKDMDEDSDSEDDDSGLNPHEATPAAVPAENFPENTVFVEVAAGDSCTFALTDEGLVYGWGTFRGNDGVLGFSSKDRTRSTPVLVPGLKKIQRLACGDNHALAVTDKGAVYAWGSGQQNQLGRRIVERTKLNGLTPREFGLPKGITQVACGAYHSFAIHGKTGKVYGWGLNSYGETGIPENAGEDEAVILHPTVIKSLAGKEITCVDGGAHHSVAITKENQCLVWGRCDGSQMGVKPENIPEESVIKDSKGNARIVKTPMAVPSLKAMQATAGSDHTIAITTEGKAYSWGFSSSYQTGQGVTDDVELATLIDNRAVQGKKLNWAGAGGQFSVMTSVHA